MELVRVFVKAAGHDKMIPKERAARLVREDKAEYVGSKAVSLADETARRLPPENAMRGRPRDRRG